MGLLDRIFGRRARGEPSATSGQAVLVHLDGTSLPDNVYEECDLDTIERRLIELVRRDRLGEFDGHEMHPTGVTLFIYGPDAERLFAALEPVLRGYPLCQNARVVVRRGGPGAAEREVVL